MARKPTIQILVDEEGVDPKDPKGVQWDTGLPKFEGVDHRENVRQHAQLLYEQIHGVICRVDFSDEYEVEVVFDG